MPRLADYDIRQVSPTPGYMLDPATQTCVDKAVAHLQRRYPYEGLEDVLFDPAYHPVGDAWKTLSKRAIALNILYNPEQSTLAEGVTMEAFDVPLFGGQSAHQIMEAEKSRPVAARILANYSRFIETAIDEPKDIADQFGLRSHPYLAGVPDSIAVRLRAATAIEEIVDFSHERADKTPLKIVSLACGAAGPIFKLLPRLEQANIPVDTVRLVDWDVMALATAASLATHKGLGEKTKVERRDLLRSDPNDYIYDADVVDILGLFEYFPLKIHKMGVSYNLAQNFIRDVGAAMKPGSMIVMGNMLRDRPHQTMFKQVWPALEQRSVPEVITLLESAGFPKESIAVRLPHDGVYAIYTLRIPKEGLELTKPSPAQRLARRVLLGGVKEY